MCTWCGKGRPNEYHILFECIPLATVRTELGLGECVQQQTLDKVNTR